MKKNKLLYIVSGLKTGGAEKVVYVLVKLLRTHFDGIGIAYFDDGPIAQKIREEFGDSVTLHHIPTKGHVAPALTGTLYRLIKEQGYTIVHTHLFMADLYGRIAAWLARVPLIITTLHSFEQWRFNPLWRFLDSALSFVTRHVIVVSPELKTQLAHSFFYNKKALCSVANTIEEKRPAPKDVQHIKDTYHIGPSDIVLVYTGRLHPLKGHQFLLDVLTRTKELQTLPWKLFLLGTGEMFKPLEERISREALGSRVFLCGDVPNVEAYLAAADIFVLPSQKEGLSLALLEAMCQGLPIVTTSVGGVVTALGADYPFMVVYGDTDKFGTALLRLMTDRSLRQIWGENNARRYHAAFSNAQFTAEHLKLYGVQSVVN